MMSPARSSAGRATAAPTTLALPRCRLPPSATRTSSTFVTTTKSMATRAGSARPQRRPAREPRPRHAGKTENKKDIMSIMAAHRIPYAATLSIAHPDDFARKMSHCPVNAPACVSCCCTRPAPLAGNPSPRILWNWCASPWRAACSRSTRFSMVRATASTSSPTAPTRPSTSIGSAGSRTSDIDLARRAAPARTAVQRLQLLAREYPAY